MPETTTHPSKEQLSAYNLGQLPPDEATTIESHISECEPCCDTIISLSSDDTFVGLLKEARELPADHTVDHVLAPASSSDQDVPAQLAEHPRYEILSLIGKGGMGDVYKARHRKMERTVALKVINRGLVRKAEAIDRFHREVKAAAQLSHPNIVTSHDADQTGDYHFMVMEFVDGVNLSQIVKDQGALPVAEACDYVRQAAIGLQHAHERGMVHRDIKPHNLMVTKDGTVKILDFGLASLAPEAIADADTVEARSDLTAAGAIMGTPDFISPEQAEDARQADIRSDIYSLGATLYFLLSGRVPFAEGSVMNKLESHANAEPEPLESLRDDLPRELAAIVSRMTAKGPGERFQTPAEVVEALETLAKEKQTSESIEPVRQVQPSRRRIGWIPLTAIATIFLAAISASIVYFIETNDGIVRVEVVDDSLAVEISGQTITVGDGNKEPLEIRAGDCVLKVRQGDFQFETKSFRIRRNEEIAFKVERLEGEIVIAKNGERFGAKPLPNDMQSIDSEISAEIMAMLVQAGQSEAEFKKKLHTALSQAAGIPNAQWAEFATDPTGSRKAIEGLPLSYLLLVRPVGPAPELDASERLRLLKQRLIFNAMSPSEELGYVSVIQPEYIRRLTLDIDLESKLLRGTVRFEAPKLYTGKVDFAARYDAGKPKVVEFTLPEYRLTIVPDEKGVWHAQGAAHQDADLSAATLYLHAALLAAIVDDERYRAIRAAFFSHEPMPGYLLEDDDMSQVVKQMRSLVSRAATRSNCWWQRDNSNGPHVLLPDTTYLHRAANIILAHARWRSQEKDHSAAMADIVALVALGRHQQRDSVCSGCLSGLANELAALRATLQLTHTLSDNQRQELATALETLPRVTIDIGRVIDSERATWAWIREHGVATLNWPVADDNHLIACVSAVETYFDQLEPVLKLPTAEALARLKAIQDDIPVPTRSVLYEVLPTFSGLVEWRQRAVDMTAATIAYLRREELPSSSECTVEVDRGSMALTWRWPYPVPTGRTETDTIDLLHWAGAKAPREEETRELLDTTYISNDTVGLLVAHPRRILSRESAVKDDLDQRLARVAETEGLDVRNLNQIVVQLGPPPLSSRPIRNFFDEHLWTVVLRFDEPVDVEAYIDQHAQGYTKTKHKHETYYKHDSRMEMWFPDNRTLIIAAERRILSLIDNPEGTGPMAMRMRRADVTNDLLLEIDVRQAGPLLLESLPSEAQAPEVYPVIEQTVEKLKRISLTVKQTADTPIRARFEAIDAEKASQLHALASVWFETATGGWPKVREMIRERPAEKDTNLANALAEQIDAVLPATWLAIDKDQLLVRVEKEGGVDLAALLVFFLLID